MKLLKGLLQLAFTVGIALYRGWIIKIFWAWFVLPVFTSLPTLSTMQAIGISFMVSILSLLQSVSKKELQEFQDESDDYTDFQLLTLLIKALGLSLALLSGWIWHHFM